MNILKTGAARSFPWVVVVIGGLAQAIPATAANGLIDFRNYIPGVVDAPVFRADGTNRLSGSLFLAQLFAGPDEYSLAPYGDPVSFGVGEMAGYWEDFGDPSFLVRAIPFPPGQRINVQVRAWEMGSGGWIWVPPPPRLEGRSPVLDLIVTDTPTPLIGLESFSLRAAPIREIYAQGDQVVLRWSAGNGGAHYVVETASGLDEPMVWIQVPVPPTLIEIDDSQGYLRADWILTNAVTVPAAYYRIRLLDP